jgi:NADPH:quinone reductase-like Zn-dependent oxidoreductase
MADAYRAIFTKAHLHPGETLLVQGSSGGVSTALIQLGRAAGLEVWATSRIDRGRAIAERLGAHRTFLSGERLPHKAKAVVDDVGPDLPAGPIVVQIALLLACETVHRIRF